MKCAPSCAAFQIYLRNGSPRIYQKKTTSKYQQYCLTFAPTMAIQ